MKDGGSAFPVLDTICVNDVRRLVCVDGGMTLRDYFAGQALVGLLAHGRDIRARGKDFTNTYAQFAYQHADSMLAEREKIQGVEDEKQSD